MGPLVTHHSQLFHPAFPDSRWVCYKHRSMLRPVGERQTAIQERPGEAGSRHSSGGAPRGTARIELLPGVFDAARTAPLQTGMLPVRVLYVLFRLRLRPPARRLS